MSYHPGHPPTLYFFLLYYLLSRVETNIGPAHQQIQHYQGDALYLGGYVS